MKLLRNITSSVYYAVNPTNATITQRAHGPDLSKYDLYFLPETATGQLDFVIQRASYGRTEDEKFDALLPGVRQVPIRGAYHYLSSHYSWKEQADFFLSVVSGIPYHFYVCDFEGAFNTLSTAFAREAYEFIRYIVQQTGRRCLLYTSPSLYNQYITPSGNIYSIDWNKVDYWQAQWLYIPDPNKNPTMPPGRSHWDLWQYTDSADGTLYGTGRSTACDLNVFNGTVEQMRTWLDLPPDESYEVTHPYKGVKRTHGVYQGWKFWLYEIDPSQATIRTIHPDPYDTGTGIANRTRADIVVNGGEPQKVNGVIVGMLDYSVQDGTVIMPRQEARPSFMVLQDRTIQMWHEKVAGVQQAITGLRYIIQNGVNTMPPNGNTPTDTEGHSRHIEGVTRTGHEIILMSEGAYPNKGLRLYTCAELMLSLVPDLNSAADMGGGGDVTLVQDGVLLNTPENIANGVHFQRRLPQFLTIYADKETDMTYGKATEILGKTPTVRSSPEVASGNSVSTLYPGVVIDFTEIVPGASVPTDKWFKLPDGNYVNYIISNREYFRVESMPTKPPIEPPPSQGYQVTVTITDANGYYGEGTITVEPVP